MSPVCDSGGNRAREGERGSAPVEFVLVGLVLTLVTLGVVQVGVVVYVRNVVHDAAVDGAYHGALADRTPEDGAARAERIIATALGGAPDARARGELVRGEDGERVRVTVVAALPVLGMLGLPAALEVTAHAPRERFD